MANLRAEITVEWAGATRTLRLTMAQILEMETATGAPFGTLFGRVQAGQYYVSDLTTVVRLGLIGGGMAPAAAVDLVRRHALPEQPISDLWSVARLVLSAAMFGFEEAPLSPPAEAVTVQPD